MADSPDEAAKSAEEAYAAAAAEAKAVEEVKAPVEPAPKPAPQPVESKTVEAKVVATPKKPVPAKPASVPVKIKKTAPKRLTADAKAKAAKRAVRVAKAAAAPAPVKVLNPKPTVTELKEKIMATAKTTDFSKPFADAFGEIQTRAQAAYDKSSEAVAELSEFTKGNVEAIVESSKILATGAQSLGKSYVEEAKSAYETATADVKELAAVKSPTELFQLQSKILRRNFEALVATGSKNTEAVLKLSKDTFAPLSGRVNLAAEKLAKVA
ncbi:TIGR01841 family phasin [Croceibacterium sp. LX-88]|jgi:phasin family protein|uniref:TIGR01841 family phasin n=1 Tax=Croceibacterium selenioxidans TaxID=2838833 RepID=A0ABS5W0D3_9SPHN|nr:phasin family protein [Croceibacterium selenioxidans]MBT2132916.1 TIGR01841 family phasin [Croceibacterium selenioxidans]